MSAFVLSAPFLGGPLTFAELFLITDPQLNGSFQINKGLRLARGLLLEIVSLSLRSFDFPLSR